MKKYRMYIDEVGNPDLESSLDPNHRFLSLSGVIIDLDYVRLTLNPEMESLKLKYFGSHPDEPVIFHRKELVNRKPPFNVLNEPQIQASFDKDILEYLTRWEYVVATVCLDKKKHLETYSTWRYDSYHYCLAVLLERFIFWLNRKIAKGDVMAESRGGKEDRRLKDSFRRLWERGTDYVGPDQFQLALTSGELKVKPKAANISGLQLVDLVAHPSRNEILKENGIPIKIAPFGAKLISILQSKYDRREDLIYGKKYI